ncbi:MAG: hypothetical protein ACXWG6_09855, partial [Usitatibacter sp.]
VFFATSLGLTYFSAPSKSSGVLQHLETPAAATPGVETKSEAKPATPASSAPAPAGTPPSKSTEIPK